MGVSETVDHRELLAPRQDSATYTAADDQHRDRRRRRRSTTRRATEA